MDLIIREMTPDGLGPGTRPSMPKASPPGTRPSRPKSRLTIQWASRHIAGFSLAACDGGTVLGWGALSPYSGQRVYAGVAEASVYVGGRCRGRGIGTALLQLADRAF